MKTISMSWELTSLLCDNVQYYFDALLGWDDVDRANGYLHTMADTCHAYNVHHYHYIHCVMVALFHLHSAHHTEIY